MIKIDKNKQCGKDFYIVYVDGHIRATFKEPLEPVISDKEERKVAIYLNDFAATIIGKKLLGYIWF